MSKYLEAAYLEHSTVMNDGKHLLTKAEREHVRDIIEAWMGDRKGRLYQLVRCEHETDWHPNNCRLGGHLVEGSNTPCTGSMLVEVTADDND